jgi:hypothetical protein
VTDHLPKTRRDVDVATAGSNAHVIRPPPYQGSPGLRRWRAIVTPDFRRLEQSDKPLDRIACCIRGVVHAPNSVRLALRGSDRSAVLLSFVAIRSVARCGSTNMHAKATLQCRSEPRRAPSQARSRRVLRSCQASTGIGYQSCSSNGDTPTPGAKPLLRPVGYCC